jgi:hypothetical protein
MLQAGVTANGKVANNLPLASARAQASLSAALSENPEILTKLWKVGHLGTLLTQKM